MHFGTPVVPEEIQDVERMIEREALERERSCRSGPRNSSHDDARSTRRDRRMCRRAARRPSLDGRAAARAISATRAQAVVRLAGVDVAVGGDEHPRLDLAEPIEHALDAEVRRARRPDGADGRRAERRDDRSPAGWAGKPATRSPGPTPALAAPPANAPTAGACSSRARRASGAAAASSLKTMAGVPSSGAGAGSRRSSAARQGRSARPASARGRSTTRSPRSPMMPVKSQTARQKSVGRSIENW